MCEIKMKWEKRTDEKSEEWWMAKKKGMVYFKMSEKTLDKIQKKTMQLDMNDLLNSFAMGAGLMGANLLNTAMQYKISQDMIQIKKEKDGE